jgi:hypothetical protein
MMSGRGGLLPHRRAWGKLYMICMRR